MLPDHIDPRAWIENARELLRNGLTLACDQCGRPFVAHSLNSRYCSQRCRNLASQERRALEAIKAREDHHA